MSGWNDGIRIEVGAAKEKLDSGKAVALDVVQPHAWDEIDGAVEGAVRIPPGEMGQRYGELPPELDIIAYCT